MDKLIEIMKRLRAECPWDKVQTHETLKPYLIEEAYELIEAIEEAEPSKIKEELGDLLLQIVFHAELSSERGEFDMNDVVNGICEKMISRHPHVFGAERFETAEEVVGQWEERKREEGKFRDSILHGVPAHMPSLLRAHRIQSRASKVGFDWQDKAGVLKKLEEEMLEFRRAVESGSKSDAEEELGDILFSLVNVSRFTGVNPEDALRSSISKFIRRFRHLEMKAAEAGLHLKDMTLSEMDRLWDEAKQKDNTRSEE